MFDNPSGNNVDHEDDEEVPLPAPIGVPDDMRQASGEFEVNSVCFK